MNKLLILFPAALLLGPVIGTISHNSPTAGLTQTSAAVANPAPATPAQMPPKEVRTVISIDVRVLADEYDSNEIATDLKLKGKIIEVSGTVSSINKDAFGYLRVDLGTRNQYLPASMKMDKKQEATLAHLQKGQRVIIRCEKMKRWGGTPYGDNCILM